MYLRLVRLRSWCCHDEIDVPLAPGLNVCVGMNASGKTMLYQAIVTALTQKHNSTSKALQDLKPWHASTLGPTATLEIVRGDNVWRVVKRFLDQPALLLEKEDHGKWRRQSDGQTAEAELKSWLDADGAAGR
ncbi:MAG: AAA family ATPase, partial [Isosphaerales bacterium]